MAVIAGNNLQIAANLLDEPEDEFHPKPFALGGLKSERVVLARRPALTANKRQARPFQYER